MQGSLLAAAHIAGNTSCFKCGNRFSIPPITQTKISHLQSASQVSAETQGQTALEVQRASNDENRLPANPYSHALYPGLMRAQWRETTVGKNGELVLEGLPFEPGQPVDVLVISKVAPPAGNRSLEGSVLEFHNPLDPVAVEQWDLLG